jgi:hypothetical protein
MRQAVDARKRTYNISAGKYNVVHVRAGDKLVSESPQLQDVINNTSWWVTQIVAHFTSNVPIVVLSIACNLTKTIVTAINTAGYIATSPGCKNPVDLFSWQRGKRNPDKVVELIAEIEIMRDAAQFMGSADSNMPRLVVKLRGTTAAYTPVSNTIRGFGETLW